MTTAALQGGLTSEEAAERLEKFGSNDPAPSRRRSGVVQLLVLFLNPLVVILLVAAREPAFHTGWFVESLATQTLVLFVIRTMRSPWRSRPSRALTATTLSIVAVGLLLPYSPLAGPLGFTPLPGSYYVFLTAATLTYLLLVEVVKRRLFPPRSEP
jgi:P-type Mg2+ transporter